MRNVLLTGGTGYIGSHIAVELIKRGYDVIIIDNLSNSDKEVLDRIELITGNRPIFYEGDLTVPSDIRKAIASYDIEAVIHCAGCKSIAESIENPMKYYKNNVEGSLNLLSAMKQYQVRKIIFSSSAVVYNGKEACREKDEIYGIKNPYGRSKYMVENMLEDISKEGITAIALRYFNPVGAHPSGLIGEKPKQTPTNIMPIITKVARESKELKIYGNDYPTKDGTGIRDYIHVTDLARGHISALEYAENIKGFEVFNLGTGKGHSVLELIKAFEKANGIKVPYKFTARRSGDVAICYADVQKAQNKLKWRAEKGLEQMCKDSWQFYKNLGGGKNE